MLAHPVAIDLTGYFYCSEFGSARVPHGSHTTDLSAAQKLLDAAATTQHADRKLPSQVVHTESLPGLNGPTLRGHSAGRCLDHASGDLRVQRAHIRRQMDWFGLTLPRAHVLVGSRVHDHLFTASARTMARGFAALAVSGTAPQRTALG